jgi:hypothetical protein
MSGSGAAGRQRRRERLLNVGIALLLSGFGFAILAIGGALRTAERRQDVVVDKPASKSAVPPTPVPTA